MHTFEQYQPRKLAFQQLVTTNNWQTKIYSITNRPEFQGHKILESAIKALPQWTAAADSNGLPVYQVAWLIAHEGREGVWLPFSWWTGGEMVETIMYFAEHESPTELKSSPYSQNSMLCVWELEVFIHERQAWIKHILEQAAAPNFDAYLNDRAGEQR